MNDQQLPGFGDPEDPPTSEPDADSGTPVVESVPPGEIGSGAARTEEADGNGGDEPHDPAPDPVIRAEGFELVDWQVAAVDGWVSGAGAPFTGTLEIFTGGGKTLLAITAMARAAQVAPDLQVAVIVPTEALARQWIDNIERFTNLTRSDIGLMGAGGKGTLERHRVLVAVLNSAARKLPAMVAESVDADSFMLVVDECHRAGAPTFAKVLDTPGRFRLGLSATPDREELDEHGEPLVFDEQRVGQKLGGVVARFSLKDAREIGWLPDYRIEHHGVTLTDEERREYEALSRKVEDLAENLRQAGVESSRAFSMQRQEGDLGDLARSYVAATSRRKDFLYKVKERSRVAAKVVDKAMGESTRRVLLFHERVAEATELHDRLQELLPDVSVVLEHSQLADGERKQALAGFRSGESPVLVSVKSLIEGIDVPEADVGVSVASSSSVRQRIQALGRVLRRSFGEEVGDPKVAEMHVLYVAGTVDELIYAKEDWGDLTGDAENTYWVWPLDPDVGPVQQDGPPDTPRPTEDQEWERLGEQPPSEPVEWQGAFAGQEYSVDTRGTVRNISKSVIANPQGAADMVAAVRGRPGGKFKVTPVHRLVLIAGDGRVRSGIWVAGGLAEPFRVRDEPDAATAAEVDVSTLRPGDPYPGPGDDEGGRFRISSRRGGVIERKIGRETVYALTSSDDSPLLAENATRLLEAWKTQVGQGITVTVNSLGHVTYEAAGERRYLADVPGGFLWPE